MTNTIKPVHPKFDTDEVLWYNNGKFGQAGYAIPNPVGKTWTNNTVIYGLVQVVGRNLFELMHREDAKFYDAPHKQFWFDLHQLILTARKRLADRMRDPADSNGLVTKHVNPAPKVFLVYPVPFFGERIRQPDIREYCELCLLMLSECMQHSDNERISYITPAFAGTIGKYLQEILALFATKYFAKTREQAYAADFKLVDMDFIDYAPSKVLTSVEMTEERPPVQWWPTENDLSQIRGLPVNEALDLCDRYPVGDWRMIADGNVFPDPTNQTTSTNTEGGGVVREDAGSAAATGFVKPAGEAP